MTVAALSLVLTNSRIRTGNATRPWATAMGILDGKLAVVGAAAEILKMADAGTRIIDAGGQLVTLPAGMAVGSRLAVTVESDGRLTVHSFQDGS